MKITLILDDSCLPKGDGAEAGKFLIMALKTDPNFFVRAADEISVDTPSGRHTESYV